MKDLQVGDLVKTEGQNRAAYEPIYSFAHFERHAKADFLQFSLEGKQLLEVTSEHLVYVHGSSQPAFNKTFSLLKTRLHNIQVFNNLVVF